MKDSTIGQDIKNNCKKDALTICSHPLYYAMEQREPALEVQCYHDVYQGCINDYKKAQRLKSVEPSKDNDAVVKAFFSIQYDNPLLNHENITKIFSLLKEFAGKVAIKELMHLQTSEASKLLKINSAEEVANKVIEQNFFLSNAKGQEFIQKVANNFDESILITILELGREQDIAEQIVYAAEEQGVDRVIYTLLEKEPLITDSTNNLENIVGTEELNQLRSIPNGILNSWSNKVSQKVVVYINNLAKSLDDMLNLGKSGDQISIIIVLLEEWLGLAASNQGFVGGMSPYYSPTNDDGYSYGAIGSGDEVNNSFVLNFDNQNGMIGLVIPVNTSTVYCEF